MFLSAVFAHSSYGLAGMLCCRNLGLIFKAAGINSQLESNMNCFNTFDFEDDFVATKMFTA